MKLSLRSLFIGTLPAIGVLLVSMLASAPAHAVLTCSATMTDVNFGPVNPLSSQTDGSATLSYSCSKNDGGTDSAMVCFHIGEPFGRQWNPRLMLSGSNTLQFQLYQDPGRTTLIWGSYGFGSATPASVQFTLSGSSGASSRTSGTIPLYGRVIGGQTGAIPGSYTDVYQQVDTAISINAVTGSTPPSTCPSTYQGSYFPFTVSATVTKQCVVNAVSDVDLGTVPASAANVANNGNISITCSNTTPYYVGLRPSNNSTVGAGLMSAPPGNTDKVPYQLYQNAGMTTLWGNTATASSAGNGVAGSGTGVAKSHTVYVRAPSADYQPDSYSDTVTVVVNY